jgi:hypothetical protein
MLPFRLLLFGLCGLSLAAGSAHAGVSKQTKRAVLSGKKQSHLRVRKTRRTQRWKRRVARRGHLKKSRILCRDVQFNMPKVRCRTHCVWWYPNMRETCKMVRKKRDGRWITEKQCEEVEVGRTCTKYMKVCRPSKEIHIARLCVRKQQGELLVSLHDTKQPLTTVARFLQYDIKSLKRAYTMQQYLRLYAMKGR